MRKLRLLKMRWTHHFTDLIMDEKKKRWKVMSSQRIQMKKITALSLIKTKKQNFYEQAQVYLRQSFATSWLWPWLAKERSARCTLLSMKHSSQRNRLQLKSFERAYYSKKTRSSTRSRLSVRCCLRPTILSFAIWTISLRQSTDCTLWCPWSLEGSFISRWE